MLNTFRNLLGPDTVGAKELALLELTIPALHENAVKKGRWLCRRVIGIDGKYGHINPIGKVQKTSWITDLLVSDRASANESCESGRIQWP
jgi:hypothetical protein